MSAAQKNLPSPSAMSTPYWEGCRDGQLRLQYCLHCQTAQFYPRVLCTTCSRADLTWTTASGRGVIVSFTVIRRAVSAAYEADVPYVVALVKLTEGPILMTRIIGCAPDAVHIDAAVAVSFESLSADIALPVFRLET